MDSTPTRTPAGSAATGVKRARCTPTGSTPNRNVKRRYIKARRLDFEVTPRTTGATQSYNPWCDDEVLALIKYVLLHCGEVKWTATKDTRFWSSAAKFVKSLAKSTTERTGNACRKKVLKLSKLYSTPLRAEAKYEATDIATDVGTDVSAVQEVGVQTDTCRDLSILSENFVLLAQQQFGVTVPWDFLKLSIAACGRLKECNRANVLYNIAKGLAEMRSDGSDSLLPACRMPMGLLEHISNFFISDSLQQVPTCPPDYTDFQISMYNLFGTKWNKLHCGPMWSVVPVMQVEESRQFAGRRIPTEARVNVPGLSDRTIRRRIAATKISTGPEIQMAVLDEAAEVHNRSWWWIKGDACDVVKGLGESVSGRWNGDIDCNDGSLEKLYDSYIQRLKDATEIGLPPRHERPVVIADLEVLTEQLSADISTITKALKDVNTKYCEKQEIRGTKKVSEKVMITLGWEIYELEELNKQGRQLMVDAASLSDKYEDCTCDIVVENIPRIFEVLRSKLQPFLKVLYRYLRKPASHVFVFMISPEERQSKPYALPVQCIPCAGISDAKVRELLNKIVKEMNCKKMKVAGFTSNGEFNSLRVRGNSRPVSILEIRRLSRTKYAHLGLKTLIAMLTPKYLPDGTLTAVKPNPAVSTSLLTEIFLWKEEGVSDDLVLIRLRKRCVPKGYSCTNWVKGKSETEVEKARSILAQLEYRYQVLLWTSKGIPFQYHVYVPEIHPITGEVFHEREDEGHVFKRIAHSTREGGPQELNLQRFSEALQDSSSGLTYPALTGKRKQSVEDAERLLSSKMADFMEKKGYAFELQYIRVLANWRRATDERGLSELQRCRYNHELLNYILDEWMPWHRDSYDFSSLEVNRDVSRVRGFTRETLIALTTNIESREYRRRQIAASQGLPENPRSSTTDDVECFFSVLRDSTHLEKDFSLKKVQCCWRKVCIEYYKRMDPSLPYYYHTAAHDRFYEGPRPEFSTCPVKPSRPKRAPRREQLGSMAGSRVTMAVSGAKSIRAEFHNYPVDLPPAPEAQCTLQEHSYSYSANH